jgi:hypothetical protein
VRCWGYNIDGQVMLLELFGESEMNLWFMTLHLQKCFFAFLFLFRLTCFCIAAWFRPTYLSSVGSGYCIVFNFSVFLSFDRGINHFCLWWSFYDCRPQH